MSSQPGPYVTAAADYMLIPDMPVMVTTPATAEPLAETGGVPATMSEALAVSPWHNRFPARPAAAFDWVDTPLQLSSGPEGPETAAELSGRQPAASALSSSVPGLQSVLLGVRDVTPDLFGSMPLIMSRMFALDTSHGAWCSRHRLEGEEASASWQQQSMPQGVSLSFLSLVSIHTLLLGFKNYCATLAVTNAPGSPHKPASCVLSKSALCWAYLLLSCQNCSIMLVQLHGVHNTSCLILSLQSSSL